MESEKNFLPRTFNLIGMLKNPKRSRRIKFLTMRKKDFKVEFLKNTSRCEKTKKNIEFSQRSLK